MNRPAKIIIYVVLFAAITCAVVLFMAKTTAGAFLTNLVIATSLWHALENTLGIIGVDGEEDLIFWSYVCLGGLVAALALTLRPSRLGKKTSYRS